VVIGRLSGFYAFISKINEVIDLTVPAGVLSYLHRMKI